MGGRASRAKGSLFEREVAVLFTDRFNVGFRRTPLSGGWDKTKFQADITCGDVNFILVPECKNHKTLKLGLWWKQVDRDTPPHKIPILVMKLSGMYHLPSQYKRTHEVTGPYVLFRESDVERFLKPSAGRELDKLEITTYTNDNSISIPNVLADMYLSDSKVARITTKLYSGKLENYLFTRLEGLLTDMDDALCFGRPAKTRHRIIRRKRT